MPGCSASARVRSTKDSNSSRCSSRPAGSDDSSRIQLRTSAGSSTAARAHAATACPIWVSQLPAGSTASAVAVILLLILIIPIVLFQRNQQDAEEAAK